MLRRQLVTGLATLCGLAPTTSALFQQPLRDDPSPVVGVWFVLAEGAPFAPHLFTFHADKTMLSANPDAGDTHTSDSDGMGPWALKELNVIVGAFEELNADRTMHKYVSRLRVEYTITLSDNTFVGPAKATYYNPDGSLQSGPYPALLKGSRVLLPSKE